MTRPRAFEFPLRLGFGCSGAWAKKWFPERQARAVLLAALEAGVRHVDTAGFYAAGEGERRLGAILREFGGPVFVSTKTGTRYLRSGGAIKDFTAIGIRTDVEASLRRLGRERLDLLYLHGPSERDFSPALETLRALKKEGKIALAGVCGEGAGLVRAVEADGVDVVMGVYNLFRREHAAVFARAKEKGVGVVAIAPLAQGLYRRGFFVPTSFADCWRIARALAKNRAELERARAARDLLNAEGWTPAQLALAFVHANPAIDVAMTTSTNVGRLRETAAAAARPAPAEIMTRLAALAP